MNKVNSFLIAVVILIFSSVNLIIAQGTSITILHTNDSHSHLDAVGSKTCNLEGTLGGIAKAASVIRPPSALLLRPCHIEFSANGWMINGAILI